MKQNKGLFLVETKYSCAGIIIDRDGIVIETAPIYKWMVGKPFSRIKKWERITNIQFVSMIESGGGRL